MKSPRVSQKTNHILTITFFVLGLGGLGYLKMLWPEALLILGFCLAMRQFLLGHLFDPIATIIIYLAMYSSLKFNMGWEILIPLPALIFVLGAFILIHEYFLRKECGGSGPSSPPDLSPDDF